MVGDNEARQTYHYDKMRGEVILEELDKEEAKTPNEIDQEKRAMLYQALNDDSESVYQGYEIRRPIPGLSSDEYKTLWTWIEEETKKRKTQF